MMRPDEFNSMIYAYYARSWRRERRMKRLNTVVRWLLAVAVLLTLLTMMELAILMTPN